MSGRAPPKAPRALLNSLAVSGAATSSSSTATTSSSQPSTSSRIGTAPPTGPRSLSSVSSSRPKHLVNGLNGPNVATIPSSLKGKQVDYSGTSKAVNSSGASHSPSTNGQDAPAEPPPPLSQPPPLPPSTAASSSQSSPPPPSSAPPPLPSSSLPPCPPSSAPPPLPPPPAPTPDPAPLPSFTLKPSIPPITFLKSLKPKSILRSSPTPPQPPSRPLSPIPPPPLDAAPLSPSPQPPSPTPTPSPPPRSPSPPEIYSLPPPLPWPSRSEYLSETKDFKVLFDHVVDKDRDGRFRQLMEKIRQSSLEGESRIKGKGKGKELLYRYEGEVVEGEQPPVIRDPRKVPLVKKLQNLRPGRGEFHTLKYEFDTNSTGPPPPTCILVLNISPLTQNQQIRRHFAVHGRVVSFEPQIDKQTGGALGIVFVKFSTHEEAKKCVERESGGKNIGLGTTLGIQSVQGEELKVVFDSEDKKKLRAVLNELDDRKRREKEDILKKKREAAAAEKRKKEEEGKAKKEAEVVQSWRGKQSADPRHRPTQPQRHPLPAHPGISPPVLPPNDSRPPPSLVRARIMSSTSNVKYSSRPTLSLHDHSSSPSTPLQQHRGRPLDRPSDRHYRPSHYRDRYSLSKHSSRSRSRSPSPISRKPGQSSRFSSRQTQRDLVLAELKKNGHNYVSVEEYGGGGQLGGGNVKEEDVRRFFGGFKVDKVLQDHLGWYVTFETADSARRASTVLNSSTRTLAHRSVTVSVHTPPLSWTPLTSSSLPPSSAGDPSLSKAKWGDGEMVDQAERIIIKELKGLLEKDVMDRVVGVKLRQMAAEEERARKLARVDGGTGGVDGEERKGLKGLSFKKNKRPKPLSMKEVVVEEKPRLEEEEVLEAVQRPNKRRKLMNKTSREDVESEDSDDDTMQPPLQDISIDDPKRKRSEVEVGVEEPAKKRHKVQAIKKPGRKSKKAEEKAKIEEVVISEEVEFDAPAVAEVRLSLDWESSLSPPSSPEPEPQPPPPPARVSPPPDPLASGLCEDDEDLYFAKLALARSAPAKFRLPDSALPMLDDSEANSPPPFHVHVTGSARSEGYYKISHSEKSVYVAQYATRTSTQEIVAQVEVPAQPQPVTSSRSNRANARRRAQGIEEINQVQRAMKLSLGETPAMDQVKFNQLQTRKKHLRFARSPIHDWGLYAMERISRGEMVIEYVGEVIRAQVADKREKAYERQGIGSSYLFRIDEDLVVDATKKGNLGRLINHSCDPNCTAKIITINGEKKIVIYAKQDIELGDEITYDYHFPIEQDKIPCLCGSARCRGYLN